MIIDIILATDMAKHFKYLSEFRNMLEARRCAMGGTDVDLINARYERDAGQERVLTAS